MKKGLKIFGVVIIGISMIIITVRIVRPSTIELKPMTIVKSYCKH